MTQQIKALATEHLDSVWRIEQRAHTHPWSETMIRNVESRGAMHHVLIIDERVIGYFYAQNIVGEVTLLNIAIDPNEQGKGYGKILLEAFLNLCEQANAESSWLEVRASNISAHQLYLNAGFNEVDRRINYYPTAQGREDAIIMSYFFFG